MEEVQEEKGKRNWKNDNIKVGNDGVVCDSKSQMAQVRRL